MSENLNNTHNRVLWADIPCVDLDWAVNFYGQVVAVAKISDSGGAVTENITGMGPHGFRALATDSEGNRIALHSNIDA